MFDCATVDNLVESGEIMSGVVPFPPHRTPADQSYDVSDVIHEVCELLGSQSLQCGVDIEVDAPPHMMVEGDPQLFQELLERLLSGVLETTPKGGDVVVTADDDEEGVEVEVAHSGTGFSEMSESQAAASNAADRTHESDNGRSNLDSIVNASGGMVRTSQGLEGWTTYTITIRRSLDEDSGSRKAA